MEDPRFDLQYQYKKKTHKAKLILYLVPTST
jgi:hypothetical protein